MIYGSLITGVFCVILGLQIHLQLGPHWITFILINLYCVSYAVGAGTVPYVVSAEVFMPEVSTRGGGVGVRNLTILRQYILD